MPQRYYDRSIQYKSYLKTALDSVPYLRLVIEQNLGAPEYVVDMRDSLAQKLVNELHSGATKR